MTNKQLETVSDLLQQFAVQRGKLRPTFVIAATDANGDPWISEGRDIRLDIVSLAKQVRSQMNMQNVTIYRYSQNHGRYVEDLQTQALAFPSIKPGEAVASDGDLAVKRAAKQALADHKAVTHSIHVKAPLETESRQALLESFFRTYKAMGGTEDELSNALSEFFDS